MADSELECSTDASGLKRNVVLETPEKEDSQTYSQTPVSSARHRTTCRVISSENKQVSSASEHVKDCSSYFEEPRAKIYQRSDLDKIRVTLFHDMEQKNKTKAQIFPVNATSFYGNNESRFLPLAPNIFGTANKKIDKSKSSPSLYDFPNKRITRKRKGGEINSGVSHGIRKLKCKTNSIKNELSDIDEDTVTEKQCEISQKENVREVENSQSIEDYNPNRKFFKHRRSVVLQITAGKKLKQKKNVQQEKKIVNCSNVFHSLNSKKQFHKQLNIGQCIHSHSEAQSIFSHSPTIIKKEMFDQHRQYQESPQRFILPALRNSKGHHSSNAEEFNNPETETENEVDEGIDQEPIYQNLAMDIENNNFSNNEMMTDVAMHNDEELKNQWNVGNNLFFMESLTMDDSFEQNNLEEENSSDSGILKYSSGSGQYEKNVGYNNVKNIQCRKCNFVYELGNKDEEMVHSNYHSDLRDIQFEGWTEEHSTEISIGTDSIIIVKPFGPKSHKEKAFDALRFIKTEIGLCNYDLIDNQKKYFFMYVREKSIIGILVAEHLNCAFRLQSNSSTPCRMFSETFPVKCGINIIWVSKNHRRQGIATKMMDCLRNRFCSNYKMDVNDIAFSIPTSSGRYFAEKYVGRCDFKVF